MHFIACHAFFLLHYFHSMEGKYCVVELGKLITTISRNSIVYAI